MSAPGGWLVLKAVCHRQMHVTFIQFAVIVLDNTAQDATFQGHAKWGTGNSAAGKSAPLQPDRLSCITVFGYVYQTKEI